MLQISEKKRVISHGLHGIEITIDLSSVYGIEIKNDFGSVYIGLRRRKKQKSHAMCFSERNASITPTEVLSLAQRAQSASGCEIQPSDWLRNSKKNEIVYMLLAPLIIYFFRILSI